MGQTAEAGTTVLFQERLLPRWPAWLICGGLIAMIAGAYGAALGGIVGWSLGLGLTAVAVIATLVLSPQIRVTTSDLRAGSAVIPRACIERVVPLDADQARAARGPGADARAYVLLRSLHASTAVRVELADPEDPHPCWLLTSSRPHELARALSSETSTDGA